jgi:hypothetical protein
MAVRLMLNEARIRRVKFPNTCVNRIVVHRESARGQASVESDRGWVILSGISFDLMASHMLGK